MRFWLALIILISLTNLVDARYRRHHHSHLSQQGVVSEFLQTPFCTTVSSAFFSLDIKNLDAFVRNIPSDKRKAALQCIEAVKRNKVLQELRQEKND